MSRRDIIERVPGWQFRTRELRPAPGEHRRWLVVLNGKPHAIKRRIRHYLDVPRYRGIASSVSEAVFVWLPTPGDVNFPASSGVRFEVAS